MSKRKSKVSGVIDVALTRNYHDYYGEEEDIYSGGIVLSSLYIVMTSNYLVVLRIEHGQYVKKN